MDSTFNKPFTFDRVVRILIGVLVFAAIIILVAKLRNALIPFFIAWLLAYMMQPSVKFFQYKLKLKSRLLSIFAVLLSVILLIAGSLWAVIPSIQEEFVRATDLLSAYNASHPDVPLLPDWVKQFITQNVDPNQIRSFFSIENLENTIKKFAPTVWNFISGTFSVIVSFTIVFVVFIYLFFILLDYEKIASGWITLIPDKYRKFVVELATDVEGSMNRYFRGQVLIATCVGILLAVGFRIVNFPLAIGLGLFAGILNMIPYMQLLTILPICILSLLKSAETGGNFWLIAGSAAGVMIVVQIIQDFYLTPKIMGKAMGLNPAVILLSLSIWGSLLGFLGLIIALPLTTLFLSYYKRFVLREDNLNDGSVK